jgi:hypothetical protein
MLKIYQFIATKMRETDIWRNATEEEFDNAMEGMEKLVMNRLYEYTYTPCLPLLTPPRPVTADDLERDRVLSQRIALFSWVRPRHLDIPELESDNNDGNGNTGFLEFAQQGVSCSSLSVCQFLNGRRTLQSESLQGSTG